MEKEPTTNRPERVRDTMRTFPEQVETQRVPFYLTSRRVLIGVGRWECIKFGPVKHVHSDFSQRDAAGMATLRQSLCLTSW